MAVIAIHHRGFLQSPDCVHLSSLQAAAPAQATPALLLYQQPTPEGASALAPGDPLPKQPGHGLYLNCSW
jgi:hypothetical protein